MKHTIMMKKLYTIYFIVLSVIIFACNNGKEGEKSTIAFTSYKIFNEKFPPLSLPYQMSTDNKNYGAFSALLSENHHVDSSFRHVFVLDSTTIEKGIDSTHIQSEINCCRFYHVGKLYETDLFSVVLYARNNLPPHDDIYIFLATVDKEGKKIDEILFHKPESTLPPTELNRTSSVREDSTIHISKLTSDYQFVGGKDEANLHKKTLHEKTYKMSKSGKIELLSEENKEIPLN